MKIQQKNLHENTTKKLTFCCKRGIQLYVESPNNYRYCVVSLTVNRTIVIVFISKKKRKKIKHIIVIKCDIIQNNHIHHHHYHYKD